MVSGEISTIKWKPGTLNLGSKIDVFRALEELARPYTLQAQRYENVKLFFEIFLWKESASEVPSPHRAALAAVSSVLS